MAKTLPHLEKIEILSNAYGAGITAELLGVSERTIQLWFSEPERKPRKDTMRILDELFAKHESGENVLESSREPDFKEKYLQSLENQIKDKDERIKLLLGYIDSLRNEMRELALINQTIAVVNQDLLVEAVAVLRKQDQKKVAAGVGKANYETLQKAKASGKLISWDR